MIPLLRYRILLAVNSLAFIAFGVSFLVSPHSMTGQFGITLAGTDAVADVCAVYGGFELAVGLFFAWCASSAHTVKPGLIAAALCLSGFFLGRVTGIVSEGHPTEPTFKLLAIDFLGMSLNVSFLIMYLRRRVSLGGVSECSRAG
jgi:hypothetical protein